MLGGPGSDRFLFGSADGTSDQIGDPFQLDFVAGAGGDVLDISDLLIGWTPQSALADFVSLEEFDTNGSRLLVDRDGAAGAHSFEAVAAIYGLADTTVDALYADANLILV